MNGRTLNAKFHPSSAQGRVGLGEVRRGSFGIVAGWGPAYEQCTSPYTMHRCLMHRRWSSHRHENWSSHRQQRWSHRLSSLNLFSLSAVLKLIYYPVHRSYQNRRSSPETNDAAAAAGIAWLHHSLPHPSLSKPDRDRDRSEGAGDTILASDRRHLHHSPLVSYYSRVDHQAFEYASQICFARIKTLKNMIFVLLRTVINLHGF